MNIGEKFRRFVATEDAKGIGFGKKLADRMIDPEKYKKELVKSGIKKIAKKRKSILKKLISGKKGRKLKFPKIKSKYKRTTIRIKPKGKIFP